MKISYNWLKTLVNTSLNAEEIAELLTSSGLEVEGIEDFESFPGGLRGLVVGQVIECGKHPDADRLSLTKVDIGASEPLSIVCGAPNVAQGQKVIVATVGTKLYPTTGEPFEIKKSKIRGALSEGMICAEDEIGLGSSHAGIMVLPEETKIGTPASEFFKIENDKVFEIGLTPNRCDAASHLGAARELAAIQNTRDPQHKIETHLSGLNELPDATGLNQIQIDISENAACPRYSGLIISGITVKDSPDWLKNRLKAIGLRPINNVVDITNFVLHELGQPLHAFDLEKIKGNKIVVRKAQTGEKFVTLDGIERTLHEQDLMICNESEPMCIAGVFGGLHSGVTETTRAVFLESAYFDPGHVRSTSKRHGLKTDSSFRFERGTDPEMTITALIRAANLIFELAGGVVSMDICDVYPEKLEPFKVAFSFKNCNDLIGKDIDKNTIRQIILNLGIEIDTEGSDGLLLKVPRFKSDVTREADLIEDVMRIYGYNNVEPSKAISYSAVNEQPNFELKLENACASLLEGFGFREIMSLSLTREAYYSENSSLVKVVNPLSNELNVLRNDMLFSGLEAIAYNINRKNANLLFFEFGRTYTHVPEKEFKYAEQKNLSLFATGRQFGENPHGLNQNSDFHFLKGALCSLLSRCGISSPKFGESDYAHFESGLTVIHNNKVIGEIGTIKKQTLKVVDIDQPVYYATLNTEALAKILGKNKIEFEEISKFPAVRRDLAMLLDRSVKYNQIEDLAFSLERKLLKDVNLFDVYEDEKLGSKKSYAVSFTLQNNESTLTDKQIDAVMEKLIKAFKEKLGAELRA